MSRVRAEALVLVNWKGVFYERYLLDRHVTALEGDNGAGKTTVMIAAYVVLLPDMTRLRFTNLGETGATGGDKGIWGRLGEPGRPAYAALDFRLPRGERVLAGVHLERKGEPTVEPTPFIVTGLGDDVRAQDLLLLADGELEQVPELTELRDAAGRLGGRLQQFSSARDYFAALFELGITPMRLGTDEERNKLNEMLKTSMTGGMSKGLLQELRSFLLKEEGGLADTLQRMRANLDACRRTRTEVLEAQRLEREIGDVYEAGEQMFAAAVAGTRQRAEEATRRVADAEARRRESAASAEAAEQALTEARDAVTRAEGRKVVAAVAADEAIAWERRVDEALTWARKLAACAGALDEAVQRRDAALAAREAADEALERATTSVGAASDARERAAAGLADLQKGLEELHRRAAAHRRATARLADARRLLDDPAIDADAATVVDAEASAALARVDEERRDIARRVDDASAHRAEHAAASAALVAVLDRPVDVDVAYDAALAVLADVRAWRDAAARRPALATELRAAEADATRQARVVERAGALGLLWGDRGSFMSARALIKSGSSASAPTTGREAAATALAEVETALTALEDEARAADEAAAEALRRLEASRADGAALEARAVAYAALSARADRLAAVASAPVTSRLELDVARAALTDRRTAIGARLGDLSARREALADEARRLTQAGGSFAPELLKLRDDLTAELLASRFDDVGVDEAARLEARLGPLAQALVVPDPEAATARLADRPATLPTVWLVAEDAALALGPDEVLGGDVIVDERDARRVTRIPARPTLGRAARERQAAALTREAKALEPEIEAARQDERAARSAQSDADALLEGLATWLLGDPAAEIEASRQRARDAETASQAARREAARARADAGRLRPRRQALLELLPDAALLDAPDQAARVTRLREALAASERAGAELARVGGAPATLERGLEALRRRPWTDDEVADARTRLSSLDARRDRLSEGLEALRFVVTNREALRWSDAEARLTERQGLVPALEAQLAAAKDALDRARAEEIGARATREKATSAFHEADARHATARERRDEAANRLAEAGVADPSEATLAAARAQAADARAALAAAEAEHGRLREEVGRADSVHRAAAQAAEGARVAEEDERRQARPALEGWDRLRPQVEAAGLLAASMSDRFMALFAGRGSVNLFPMAHEARALLFERLRTAQRGPEVLERLERGLGEVDQTTGEGYLRAWIVVRDWLRSCLPAQIAEMDEPLAALGRFRDHLADLVARLERQERDLRGASEDVARGIDVQVRKARGRVRRLNEHLVGVAFGSIRGIRVRMERVERMERVLHALRSGEAQGLLFQEDLPVEDALDEIFKRFGGGRTGGQRLLDYREYLHLHVEVLRQDAAGWEVANPTRLSTGEAIGVGAALMMVVLTEWERDANLLRGRRSFGSMRFLFLDEANRLDQANLGTVFDLCRNLDLQLLVAAPEVARAEGCTVFRLVRTRGGDGREEVLVSGRRVVADAAEA